MADSAVVSQLKFRITSLESQLTDKQRQIEEYQTIQSEADSKIKALSKMHADKVKTLLNSIQILKKEKASIEGLSKQHKRSKLIEQLNKQIGDQDIVIEILRKFIYQKEGKQQGRNVCDQIIVKALTKGPDRIRPLSRQQLRMQIDKLKSINLNLESKMKNGGRGKQGGGSKNIRDDVSEISEVSEQSFINHNEEILKRMKEIQMQNQNMKLQANAKLKIIQKLKIDLKQKDKLKAELELSKNDNEIVNHKLKTLEKLMKQSKENTNAKIIQLYERQVKVQELEMISKENSDKLRQAQQSHNILIEQIKLEKEQLQAQLQSLKSQNEQLILENIAGKKRLDELKKILKEMDDLNDKQKDDLKNKLEQSEQNITAIVAENNKYKDAYKNVQTTLFKERADWVEQKANLLEELRNNRQNAGSKELIGKYMQDIAQLKEENSRLKEMLESGGTGGDDRMLLERLQNYKRKLQFYESKGDKSAQSNYYDELFKKYNELAEEFHQYKLKYGQKEKGKKLGRKHYIEIDKKEQSVYENMSSGISGLNLEEIDSDILDNFDSSYEYQIIVNQWGKQVKVPKITEADKQLLKLITSDLWNFVKEDKIGPKIKQAQESYFIDDFTDDRRVDMNEVRKIKNLTNPRGHRVVMYEEEIQKLDEMNESVSITSARPDQLNKFDSDVDIDMRRFPRGASNKINTYKMDELSISVSSQGSSVPSSAKEGESDIGKKKRKRIEDKGSRLEIKKGSESEFDGKSSIESSLLNSDVSSININESELERMGSDIEGGVFKKKKK